MLCVIRNRKCKSQVKFPYRPRYILVFYRQVISGGNLRDFTIINRVIFLYYLLISATVIFRRPWYMPVPGRRLLCWFAVNFRALLLKHCGKIIRFRSSIASRCHLYFGRKFREETWPSLNLKARRVIKERKVVIRPTRTIAEWVARMKIE